MILSLYLPKTENDGQYLDSVIKFDSKQNKERFINCGTGMIVI